MSFQPGANIYTQGFGSRPENVEVPHIEARAPSTSDVNYPIGKQWVNTAAQNIYFLVGLSTVSGVTSATWEQIGSGSGSGPIDSLTGNVNYGPVTATGGVVEILGQANQLTTISNPGNVFVAGLTNGVSIGSYQSTTPPVGGLIVPGQSAFGTATPTSYAELQLTNNSGNFPFSLFTTGIIPLVGPAAGNVAYTIFDNTRFQPAIGGAQVASIFSQAAFYIPADMTVNNCGCFIANPLVNLNSGTISNCYGFYAAAYGGPSAGTINDAFGGYFTNPGVTATNSIALYADDLSIGVTRSTMPIIGTIQTAPPTSADATNVLGPVTFNIPLQNTLGYDALFVGTVEISAATAGILSMAVGGNPTPSGSPLTPAITTSSTLLVNFSAYVPNNYFFSLSTISGSLTVASVTTIATPV